MVEIHDPVFADELCDRWNYTLLDIIKLHGDDSLTPYLCREIRFDTSTGAKTAVCDTIMSPTARDVFGYDSGAANIICYPGDEIRKYEFSDDALKNEALKRIKHDYSAGTGRHWSMGIYASDKERQGAGLLKQIRALRKKIDDIQTIEQNVKSKTEEASIAAQETGVERWKKNAAIIAKISYDCGKEDRKGVTRTQYKKLAATYGGLPKVAVDLLRDALPEGVTRVKGGAPSQG